MTSIASMTKWRYTAVSFISNFIPNIKNEPNTASIRLNHTTGKRSLSTGIYTRASGINSGYITNCSYNPPTHE